MIRDKIKLALVVDIDTDRPDEDRLMVQPVMVNGQKLTPSDDDDYSVQDQMQLLAHGAGLLMRCAEKEGKQPIHKSIRQCIDILEMWLTDPEAIANTDEL